MVLEQFQTDTADYADYVLPATTQLEHWDIHTAYGHTDVLLNRPAIAPRGRRRGPTRRSSASWRARMGFDDPCFADNDEQLCRQAFGDRVDFDELLDQGFATLAVARCAVRRGRLSHARRAGASSSATGWRGRAWTACPTTCRTTSRPAASPRYPLAMISPPARNFLNSTFVNVQQPARHRGRAAAGDASRTTRAARGIADGAVVRVFNDRGEYHCKARGVARARGRAWSTAWASGGASSAWRGTNVNQLTSQRLTDLGRGPVFYDCLVRSAGGVKRRAG